MNKFTPSFHLDYSHTLQPDTTQRITEIPFSRAHGYTQNQPRTKWWLGTAAVSLFTALGYATMNQAIEPDHIIAAPEIVEKICPVLRVEILLKECVYEVNNGRPFKSYIDEVITIVQAHKSLFVERFPHLDIDKLLDDLRSIRESRSALKIAWKLWNYWPLLPDSFWKLSNWERKRLIEQRLQY